MNATFEIGKTYSVDSGPAHFEFTIVSRTNKFITYIYAGKLTRVGVTNYGGHEYAMPFGKYSQAIQIDAAHGFSEVSA